MIQTREYLLEYFEKKNIEYKEYSHEKLFTVKDSKKLRGAIAGAHTKNLFLKDKKNNLFLISCLESRMIDLKKVRSALLAKNLSFCSENILLKVLGVGAGSVTPFGLINDIEKKTKFYFDKSILDFETVNFHPLINNYTVNMSVKNFMNFIKSLNVELHLINLEVYRVE
ncbi:MAG: Prolyl-tRNA editing protein ProX [Alphaproteobacteria bacterium MarineAlpha5_Bin11]|nr:DNA-binding protein [Pelagibacteraceae bacterium]PPR44248.1 MAG: Prolyl-tRNA editing protein ProX [Alphaproteobacteria bacterium MarineAlpha5_Bin11]PPR51862.1 MAG: Prolyl-tRNA editing protein ProX [Alphaproteobacteria bacterium MarineAlpha5_Bin10]|tara:strand:- start:16817 stop:17323 length:507 start_codon:yes stop_codon:yes gene_type:complete